MAASGIAEHNEARRREMVYLRKAYLLKQQQNQQGAENLSSEAVERFSQGNPTPYDRQANSMGPSNEAVDRQRRDAHRQNMQKEYSAKLPNRYTSIDYSSQW